MKSKKSDSFLPHEWLWMLLSLLPALSLAQHCLDAPHLAHLLRCKAFTLVGSEDSAATFLSRQSHAGQAQASSCLVTSILLFIEL